MDEGSKDDIEMVAAQLAGATLGGLPIVGPLLDRGITLPRDLANARKQRAEMKAVWESIEALSLSPEYPRSPDDAFLSPSALYRTLDIDSFVGRDWIVEEIDRWIAYRPSGFLVLQGDAGVGKTALLAHLAKTRRWHHHFIGYGGRDPGVALRNLAAQIVRDLGSEAVYVDGRFFARVSRTPDFYELLESAAEARSRRAEADPLVIVIDALDELDNLAPDHGSMPIDFPAALPTGVYVVMSRQPGRRSLPVNHDVLLIERQDPRNLEDVKKAIDRLVLVPSVAAQIDEQGADAARVARTIASKVNGLWIYLRYLSESIRNDARTLRALDDLPDQLEDYFARTLAADVTRDHEAWSTFTKRLLGGLGAAREPFLIEDLCRFSGVEDVSRARLILEGEWRPFLDLSVDEGSGNFKYQAYHSTLLDFLNGRGLTETDVNSPLAYVRSELRSASLQVHRSVANAYLREFDLPSGGAETQPKLAGPLDGDYGLRRLPEHLLMAGMSDDLHGLFGSPSGDGVKNSWFDLHERSGRLFEFFQSLNLAQDDARSRTEVEIRDGLAVESIVLELRYMLLRSLFRSRSASMPPALIGRLAAVPGNEHNALVIARHVIDPAQRIDAMRRIADATQNADLFVEAIEQLPLVRNSVIRGRLLVAMSEEIPASVVDRVLPSIVDLEDEDQARVISQLASRFEPVDLMPAALQASRRIKRDNHRAKALAALARELSDRTERNDTFREAIRAAVKAEGWPEVDIEQIASWLPSELVAESIHAFDTFDGDEVEQVRRQFALISRLPEGPSKDRRSRAICKASFRIRKRKARRKALAIVAKAMSAEEVKDAFAVARTTDNEVARTSLLTALAPHLGHAERAEAIGMISGFARSDNGLALMRALGAYLDDRELAIAVDEIQRLPETFVRATTYIALASTRPRYSPDWRDIMNLALRAVESLQDYNQISALILALEEMDDEPEIFRAAVRLTMAYQAPILRFRLDFLIRLIALTRSQTAKDELLEVVITSIPSLAEDFPRHRLEVADAIAPLLSDRLTMKAVEVVRSTEDAVVRKDRNAAALIGLARVSANRASEGALRKLVDIAGFVASLRDQNELKLSLLGSGVEGELRSDLVNSLLAGQASETNLRRLAPYLEKRELQGLLDAVSRLDPDAWANVAVAACERFPDDMLPIATALVDQMSTPVLRATARINLLHFLPIGKLRTEQAQSALDDIRAIDSLWDRVRSYESILEFIPSAIDEAYAAVCAFEFPPFKIQETAHVARYLSEEQLAGWWQEICASDVLLEAPRYILNFHQLIPQKLIVNSLYASMNEGNQQLGFLIAQCAAGSLPTEVIRELVAWVETGNNPDLLAAVLTWLCPFEPTLTGRAISSASTISDQRQRVSALADLALVVDGPELQQVMTLLTMESSEQVGHSDSLLMDRDWHGWLSQMLDRGLVQSWPYLRESITESPYDQLIGFIPKIAALDNSRSGAALLDATVYVLEDVLLAGSWEEMWTPRP